MKPQIPWLRVFVEGVVIVGSILLAFGIDAWWEGVQERGEEQEILTGLRAHFEDVQARLDLWVGIGLVGEDLAARALRNSQERLSNGALDSLMSSFWAVNVIDRGGGPLDALLASGRLELIEDRRLREQLARWPDRMEDLHTNDLAIRSFVHGSIVPYAASQGVPDGDCITSLRDSQGMLGERAVASMYCVHDGGPPEAYRALMRNPEFRALLTTLVIFRGAAAADYADASDAAEEMVRLIGASLGS